MSARRGARRIAAALALLLALRAAPVGAFWGDADPDETGRIAGVLGLGPGAVIADVGAGDGRFSVALAAIVGPSGRVYATELDAEDRATIAETARRKGLANVEVVAAGTKSTGLAPGCCDAVLLRGVYHHLTEPAAIDADLLAALRTGGRLAVVDFPPSFWLAPWTPEGIPANRGGHGIRPELVRHELEAAGFAFVALHEDWPGGWLTRSYCEVFRKPGRAAPATTVSPRPG